MKTALKHSFIALTSLLLFCSLAPAATNDPTTALQKALFEEEANHDLNAAISGYQSVIAQFDKDRKLAATAIFRLGECYRKQGKTNEATAQYERILREFPDQAPLVTLSRSYLAAAGPSQPAETAAAAGTATPSTSAEAEEVKRIQTLIKDSPDLINAKDTIGRTPLHQAAQKGQLVVAQFLLNNGAEVDSRDRNGATPLHLAVRSGNKAMAELLLSHQANVQAAENDGSTPLYLAAQQGYRSLLEFLLAHKADVNAHAGNGWTPLHAATANGFKSIAEVLLAHGADVNARSNSGDTPLHLAAEKGNQSLAELLLANKADVNALNQNGETPLFAAAEKGQLPVATLLLAHGADVDLKGPSQPFGWTPLVAAIDEDQKDMVALLLKHHANPNVRFHTYTTRQMIGTVMAGPVSTHNVPGYTPLLLATSKNLVDITELLLAAKADPNLKSDAGVLPIFNVLYASNLSVDVRNRLVKLLLEHGADPNVTTTSGALETPLLIAAERNDKDLVKLLLSYKANPNAPIGGWTILHVLAANSNQQNYTAVAALLLDAGANVNALAQDGKTPLQLVAKGTASNQTELAALLRQHGGVERMPDFTALSLTRKGLDNPITVFRKDTNGLNAYTLLETLANYYADPNIGSRSAPAFPGGFGSRPPIPSPTIPMLMSGASFPFPDLSNLRIHRPLSNKPNEERIITVTLPSGTNAIDCTRDVRLQFGDVVEIPEREHSLAEPPTGLSNAENRDLNKCLQREVTFIAKTERVTLTLDGKSGTYLSQALRAGKVQAILRSTSDFTQVHVTRPEPGSAQPKQITENVLPFLEGKIPVFSNDLWLENGDTVEVPDK